MARKPDLYEAVRLAREKRAMMAEKTPSMRAAERMKPDGNSQRTRLRRRVTVATRATPVRMHGTPGMTRSEKMLKEYEDRRYARRWKLVWRGFWIGYGIVAASAIAICA